MITYNILTQKYYFCYWYVNEYFQNSVQLLANELEIHNYLMITLKIAKSH